MQRARLYVLTLRHLRASQMVARASLYLKRQARVLGPAWTRTRRLRAFAHVPPPEPGSWALPVPAAQAGDPLLGRIDEIARGRWTFLSTTVDLGTPVDWDAGACSQLWRYHLHYFDDALLMVQAGEAGTAVLRDLVADWIARVPCGAAAHRDAWHPYVVSLRLVNWLLARAAAPHAFDGVAAFDESLREHSAFIAANLERDVEGNHLLKNLKAVAVAAIYWKQWIPVDEAVDRFTRALEAQTLLDGVHYERSPMYHCQVLVDALEVVAVLVAARCPIPPSLAEVTARLHRALASLTHPDGDIALFGDSALGMSTSPAEVDALYRLLAGHGVSGALAPRHRVFATLGSGPGALSASPATAPAPPAGRLPVHAGSHPATHSGLVPLSAGPLWVLFDVGAACPDELPAHAHADTFTFELSVGTQRFIVDTGVSEYRAGRWRDYERSTRAHNTVEVDGADSTECWGSFRAARRARVTRAEVASDGAWQTVVATHDGYTRLPSPVEHTRALAVHADGVVIVRDTLSGHGRHAWATHLHLHPDVTVAAVDGGLRLERGAAAVRVAWSGVPAPDIVTGVEPAQQGWYAERFGERRPAAVVTWRASGGLPADFILALVVERGQGADDGVSVGRDGVVRCADGRWYDNRLPRGLPVA